MSSFRGSISFRDGILFPFGRRDEGPLPFLIHIRNSGCYEADNCD
jgi:hypothetical protein